MSSDILAGSGGVRQTAINFTDEATGKHYRVSLHRVKDFAKNATVTVSNTEIIRDETVVEPFGVEFLSTRNNDKLTVTVVLDDGRKVAVSADEGTRYSIQPGHFKYTEKMLKPEGREDLKALVKTAFEQHQADPTKVTIGESDLSPDKYIPK